MRRVLLVGVALSVLSGGQFIYHLPSSPSTYSLPNDDNDCPANCRVIPWLAGTDVWNGNGQPGGGSIPSYTAVPCTSGLTEGNGTTNNASAIQTCLNALSSGQAAVLPAGIYYVNSQINITSNKVLRGSGMDNCTQGTTPTASAGVQGGPAWMLSTAFDGDTGVGAACTTLKFGASGMLAMHGGLGDNITKSAGISIVSGYTKGSTSLTFASAAAISAIAANDYIVIYEQPDSGIPSTATGAYGTCDWCGEANNAGNIMGQITKVTAKNSATLTINRPMYYTFVSGSSPQIKEYTPDVVHSGIEDLKINGFADRTEAMIGLSACFECWVKNVELYHDGNSAKAFHIYAEYAYAGEIRDSLIHDQRATSSDRAYGIGLFQMTSDFKIENNTLRALRHLGAQEGGGSGNVWIYNYGDDPYYLYDTPGEHMDSQRMNHGAHPYFILNEGNIMAACGADGSWGSSSHGVYFRNWCWGDLSGYFTQYTSSLPNGDFNAMRLDRRVVYYSLVGNVLGRTGLHTNWSNATLQASSGCNTGTRSVPVVYWVGCEDSGYTYDSGAAMATTIRHGNYDYKTGGVAHWDGGSNHTLANSLYYSSKPSWYGNCTWPPVDPTTPTTADNPAKKRFDRSSC